MFKEDLGEFFNDDEMADSAIISGSDVLGIFDNQFAEVHGIESMRPIFTCPESDVLNVKHGDELSIDLPMGTIHNRTKGTMTTFEMNVSDKEKFI